MLVDQDLPTLTACASYLVALAFIHFIASTLYTAYLGPLRNFPGPTLAKLTSFYHLWILWKGSEPIDFRKLHDKYGSIVRIEPNKLSCAGEHAFKEINGFRKAGEQRILKWKWWYLPGLNGIRSIINEWHPERHQRLRKLLAHSFSDKSLKEMEGEFHKNVDKLIKRLEGFMLRGEKVDMLMWYNCTSVDLFGELAWTENLKLVDNGSYNDIVRGIFENLKEAAKLRNFRNVNYVTSAIANLVAKLPMSKRAQQQNWDYAVGRVDLRCSWTPPKSDLWAAMIASKKDPKPLTMGEHYANASTFLVAGTETTATALSGTTFWLLINPQYMEKLVKEIRETFISSDQITMESVSDLTYTNACLKEGLRIYPPVPTLLHRISPKGGVYVDGQFIPEGTIFGVHSLALSRSPNLFKDPDLFRPERWLGDPEYANDCLHSPEPFNTGPRACLGKNMAWVAMRLILVTTLWHYDMTFCEESRNWDKQRVYTLWEKIPLFVKLSPAKRD